jgi:AraC-like DNA-binding protein
MPGCAAVTLRPNETRCEPLAETAHQAGFADQAHFTRTFKAAFGLTPGRYVRLCAGQRR